MQRRELSGPPGIKTLVVPATPALLKPGYECLSAEERARFHQYTSIKRRREFVAGRVAARELLSKHLGCSPSDVPLQTCSSGAVIVDAEEWCVSIAHSGAWAGAACAQHKVGLDLEEETSRSDKLERFMLHEEDRNLWPTAPTSEEVVRWWVIKEAVLKARQSGLRMMATRLQMLERPDSNSPVRVEEPDGTRWKVWFGKLDNYAWAIAAP